MDGVTLLARARDAGLFVRLDDSRLVVRGPRRLEPLATELIAHKDAIVVAIEAEIAWRVERMRQLAAAPSAAISGEPRRPVPFLHLGAAAVEPSRCLSCAVEPATERGVRGWYCVGAAQQVIAQMRAEGTWA